MSRIKSEKLGQDLSMVFTQQNNVEGRVTFNGSSFNLSHGTLAANGTAAAPSLAFANSTGTGFYRNASNVIGIATAGSERATISGSGVLHLTAPGYITCATAGTVGAATVTATEHGDGRDHTTVLTLANFIVGAIPAAAAALAVGNRVYYFPAGVHIEDIQYIDLALTLPGTAVAADTGLGSTLAAGAQTALSAVAATAEDRLTGQAITTAAGGGTAVKALLNTTAGMHTGIALNGSTAVKDVFLNSAGTWNVNNAGNLLANGTVVLKWTKIA